MPQCQTQQTDFARQVMAESWSAIAQLLHSAQFAHPDLDSVESYVRHLLVPVM